MFKILIYCNHTISSMITNELNLFISYIFMPPFEKGGHIALHLSVGMSVGMSVALNLLQLITQ